MHKIGLAIAAMAVATLPAMAADLVIDAPGYYTDPGFDWSGFYAGLSAGYGSGNARSVSDGTGIVTDVPLNGGLLGVTLGANAQFDGFVLGAEGDVMWSGVSGTAVCVGTPAFNCNANVDWLGSIRARAGVTMDNVLLFATGGLAIAGGTGTVTPPAAGITNTYSDTYVGWTLGAGVEVAVTESVSVKAEYGYYDLGSRTAPVGTLASAQTVTSNPVVHVVKAGLNFHF